MAAHSSVNYVEPNITSVGGEYSGSTFIKGGWKYNDDFERAPRLEDYSIAVNLEVEICSRNNISQSKTITSDVLILSYKTNINNGESVVNFMGGTKVKTGNDMYRPIPYLTTNYADMYVGDLINYGTTEMIGIKSIDVEYLKSCVPQITIKFTDVRGLSLFQPTELSRTNSYLGINGINVNNVAQSFFQCFFRVPMPKFTITIKGFYGKPVTYETMCDKFDTNFNSNTGDFDITARFIGYSYSFLTDISIDALLAAPYSDYGGMVGNLNKYWAQNRDSGRFTIPNKDKTDNDKMPTLFDIWLRMKSLLKEDADVDSSLTEEEKTHSEEISELSELQDKYRTWYEKLFTVLTDRYGKDYCYLFKEEGSDGEYYRILILANSNSPSTLENEYESFPDSFKQINKDLYAAIETYNSKGSSFKKLKNISQDFSSYVISDLFNNTFINSHNDVVFNGFSKNCTLPKTQVIKHLFYGVQYSGDTNEEIVAKEEQHKKHILETIYGNGTDQYVKCYSIEAEYRSIRDRINALQTDANASVSDRERKKKMKALNREMFNKLGWYPSVENFTKIMMAHLETLMNMMYDVVNKCEGRTAKQLGVIGNCSDVDNKTENDVIPPFPRVTKNVLGDDGITKIEDAWVGDYNKGEKPFEEVDFINGLFNGVERIEALLKDSDISEEERNRDISNEGNSPIIKHPLSSFDFCLTKSPYGSSSDISNDIKGYEFAGKVAIRMFNILALNTFRIEFSNKIIEDNLLNKIARTEANNFHDTVKLANQRLITMIRDGDITPDKIVNMVTSANTDSDCPWGQKPLFDKSETNMWLNGYHVKNGDYENNLYPIQGYTFSQNEEWFSALNAKTMPSYDGCASVWNIPNNITEYELRENKDGFGNVIFLDNFKSIEDQLNSANSESDGDDYTEYYNMIQSACTFGDGTYNSFIEVKDTPPSICKKITNDNAAEFDIEGKNIKVGDEIYTNDEIGNFAAEAREKTLTDYTITEIFTAIKNDEKVEKRVLELNYNNSLKNFIQTYNYLRDNVGGVGLKPECKKLTSIIMGIKLNTTNIGKYLLKNKTVSYVPKLAALQIGAIIFASGGIHVKGSNTILREAQKYLPTKNNIAEEIYQHISSLSKPAKLGYLNYYVNWCKSHTHFIKLCFGGSEADKYYVFPKEGLKGNTGRRLLKQSNPLVKELTNELLSPIAIVKLSLTYRNKDYNNAKSRYELNKSKAIAYLNAFIGRLKEIFKINYTEDSEGNLIRTTDEPKKTTDDMKAELYRYMKQVYDKWIPMSSLDEWKLDSYFIDESGEEQGHKFYFIDSYYNEIGHKLLLNPKIISEKIDALLRYRDVNAMMLGFMADIYAANKCMLMSIQNFADLKKKHSMDEMFTTVPYNSIDWRSLNKYPSFVVVYPYEPSKNLDIPSNEYKNDGFMLNDEYETPEAIRTKSDVKGQYRIPAFGVSYGKQYQSYFKSVNIDMKSPIATQQSIKAKHFIIREQTSNKEKGVASQDLYDVYSTQSYNCSVEMMGCAWVQPLMYFVLLNVPMFRGSYMIMKVKHSIKPGDMTTTFTGCRMANVSNKLVEDIFTDEDFLGDDSSISAYEIERQLKADISNDCPYKIYPLYGDSGVGTDLSNELNRKIELSDCASTMEYNLLKNDTVLMALSRIAANEGGQASQKLELQEMLVATTMYNRRMQYGGYKSAVFKHLQYDIKKAAEITPKDWVIDAVRNIFTQSPAWILNRYNSTTVKNPNLQARVTGGNFKKGDRIGSTSFTVNDLKKIKYFSMYQEYDTTNKKFTNDTVSDVPLIMAQDADEKGINGHCFTCDKNEKPISWGNENMKVNEDLNNKKDIATAFFEAVDKSAQYTPSIGIKLKNLGVKDGYLKINQSDGKTDKLGVVFDMILNSEYYDNIQELGYVYPNGGLITDSSPSVIYCKVVEKVDTTQRRVWFVQYGNTLGKTSEKIPTTGDSVNHNLLKTLGKKYAELGEEKFHKEVPQVSDVKTLDSYKPENCDNLFNSGGSGNNANPSEISPNDAGTIDGWDVGKACAWIISHNQGCRKVGGETKCGISECASYVEDAIAAGGGPLKNRMSCGGNGHATNLRYHGILEKNGFVQIDSGTVAAHGNPTISLQAGDVAILGPESGGEYHACLYTASKGWCSDFIQRNMNVYGTSHPYAIYRFHNKKKS